MHRALNGVGIALIAMIAACDPVVRVSGTVHDEVGNPIGGVAVVLQAEGRAARERTTANDGTFYVTMIGVKPQGTKILFRKPGFLTVERSIADRNAAPIDVVLSRAAARNRLPAEGR
jgi:hypothetical protein